MVYDEYLWLVVVGSIGAFWFGWGTGSNDIANAFATSVGAKTLTLKQAVLIAAVFEFTGAMVLGRVVTDTIAGGISDTAVFVKEPEIYAYGMMIALFASALWQTIGSYNGWNVSSTHSIIGGIIGFSLVYKGADAVNWATPNPKNFPPYNGVVPIVLAWFVAPLLGGAASATIFALCRTLVLRHANAYNRSYWVLPPIVLLTAFVNIYFVFTKGAKKALSASEADDWSDSKSAWIALVVAGGCAVLTAAVALPILKFRARRHFAATEARDMAPAAAEPNDIPKLVADSPVSDPADPEALNSDAPTPAEQPGFIRAQFCGLKELARRLYTRARTAITYNLNTDVFEIIEEDPWVKAMHERAEVFDPRAEYAFSYLQVFSAICVIFAHGAGEVGYLAGPLGTIWNVVNTGALPSKVNPPVWVVLIGAVGLVVGLATYGANVCRAMGIQMAKLSPTRGFAAELATSLVIMVASQYGLPVSSSQVITGAIVGVGALEGITGVNWKWFGVQLTSWVCTMIFMGVLVGAVFAQGVYAPGRASGNEVIAYEGAVTKLTADMLNAYNADLRAWFVTNPAAFQQNAVVQRVKETAAAVNGLSKAQTARSKEVLHYLNAALALYQDNTQFRPDSDGTCPPALRAGGGCSVPSELPAPKLTKTPAPLKDAKD